MQIVLAIFPCALQLAAIFRYNSLTWVAGRRLSYPWWQRRRRRMTVTKTFENRGNCGETPSIKKLNKICSPFFILQWRRKACGKHVYWVRQYKCTVIAVQELLLLCNRLCTKTLRRPPRNTQTVFVPAFRVLMHLIRRDYLLVCSVIHSFRDSGQLSEFFQNSPIRQFRRAAECWRFRTGNFLILFLVPSNLYCSHQSL